MYPVREYVKCGVEEQFDWGNLKNEKKKKSKEGARESGRIGQLRSRIATPVS